MRRIKLTKGKFAKIDDDDFERISKWKWHVNGNRGYAVSDIRGRKTYMHRLIMRARKFQMVDHINFNTLDNRKINLRRCVPWENSAHRRVSAKGIRLKKGKWDVRIYHRGDAIYVGRYVDEKIALIVFDAIERVLRKEFVHKKRLFGKKW
jgi:hypothetical protein